MDLNLSLAADYVHDLVWSDRLLDEWQRVIVREGHRTAEAAERIAEHIRVGFAETRIPAERYKVLLDELEGPDPDDLHHMAAAIAAAIAADTLVTWNLADSPPTFSAPTALRPPHPILISAHCLSGSPLRFWPRFGAWPCVRSARRSPR